ncbi:MAG: hypothetical protein NW217_04480 [Hyphomicrobiaceae bacterium]|nr:hypothetical protein [Hyphomicrobiaceae bacterium]
MDRRTFLTTGVVATAAVAGGTSAQAQPAGPAPEGSHRLRMATIWRDDVEGPADQAGRFAASVSAALGPKVAISVSFDDDALKSFGAGAFGGGQADLLHVSGGWLSSAFGAEHAYFTGLPLGGASPRDLTQSWLQAGGGQDLWDAFSATLGFKPLLVGHLGARPMLWSRRPIATPGDLTGLKVHAEGLAGDILTGLGARRIAMSDTRVATALADGDLDAALVGGALTAAASGVPKVAPHALEIDLDPAGPALVVAIRLAAWHGLGSQGQAVLTALACEAYARGVAETRATEPLIRKSLSDWRGVAIRPAPPVLTEAVHRVRDGVIAGLAASSPLAARLDRSLMAFAAFSADDHRPIG